MFLHFDHNSFPSIFFGFVWNFPSSKLLLKFVILEIASIFSLLFLSDLLNKLVCKEELFIYNFKPKSGIFPRERKQIKRETPKDAKLCSENRQNNAKFPEGMQFPCYPKHLLGSASLKEKNASTLAINCRRRVMVSVKMILIIILRLLYIIIYHSSNCDWVYWPYYIWKMMSLRN